MSEQTASNLRREYESLTRQAGVVLLEGRTLVELSGADRAAFLQNFCTNDVLRLDGGTGCEAFLTTVQGKTLAHLCVYCHASTLMLETVAAQSEVILQHLDRYLIQEDVQLANRGGDLSQLLLAGNEAPALLQRLGASPPTRMLCHVEASLAGKQVVIRKVPFVAPPALLVQVAAHESAAVLSAMRSAGALQCTPSAMEILRVECGFPWYGVDIQPSHLPQEVDRNALAISFEKGCYLGQEVIARIDALGHVNRLLRRLRLSGDVVPKPATSLMLADEKVGEITSAVYSCDAESPVALGYVRRELAQAGQRLETDDGDAVVLPA